MTGSRDSREGSKARAAPFEIGGLSIAPGERRRFDIPIALLPTHTPLHLPVTVINGRRPGPRLWLSAAVHGDELNGVEAIRRALEEIREEKLHGVVLAIPIVNVFGFIQQSRYLPDRRDLNRSFPGSRRGSLASRIAHLFMEEIVARCTHGIDMHTASLEKANYPQVRANLKDPETRRIAEAFAAPIMVHAPTRDGSLRAAAARRGIPVLVYEAGEPQRFNAPAIETGVRGILGVLHELGMHPARSRKVRRSSIFIEKSSWVRARRGGLLRLSVEEGEEVAANQALGAIADPFGDDQVVVRAPFSGFVIGKTNNPVVHGGDAIVHLGRRPAD